MTITPEHTIRFSYSNRELGESLARADRGDIEEVLIWMLNGLLQRPFVHDTLIIDLKVLVDRHYEIMRNRPDPDTKGT